MTAQEMLKEFANRSTYPRPITDYVSYDFVKHAAKLLETLPIGERVVIEGSCPSGSTYCGYKTWDGEMETAQAILVIARENSHGAYRGWLRREADCRQGIWSAQLRTGG